MGEDYFLLPIHEEGGSVFASKVENPSLPDYDKWPEPREFYREMWERAKRGELKGNAHVEVYQTDGPIPRR